MFFKQKYPYRLLTPGPVPLHPEVQKILAAPMIHHRTPEFEACLNRVCGKLKEAFATTQNVFMHTATGSGAMESAMVNTLSPGNEVLCIVSGKFGERWATMGQLFGLKVHILNVPWGEAVKVDAVEHALKANPQVKAVFCQACETSTATIHPIREIAAIIKKIPHTIFIVDAITAIGAMPLEMDNWGLDVVIGGSQKAFMLPTGLSFVAVSHKAWQFVESSRLPKFYWDLKSEYKTLLKGETHFSTAVPLVRALDLMLDKLTGVEKAKTLKRIENLAQGTREALAHLGFQTFSQSPSPSVTALTTPQNMDSQKLREHVENKYNITIMGGQDQLKGKIIRIGHLGHITNEDMLALIDVLYLALKDFGIKGLAHTQKSAAVKTMKRYL